jgi:glycine cleavage system regulatory protein
MSLQHALVHTRLSVTEAMKIVARITNRLQNDLNKLISDFTSVLQTRQIKLAARLSSQLYKMCGSKCPRFNKF